MDPTQAIEVDSIEEAHEADGLDTRMTGLETRCTGWAGPTVCR
jgi:hypothetical protein